ncbi:flavin reductase family protein [Actinomadura sediminis]|uniref:Flavin reductase family protein n=1 Tax=Actinomadura sediminis TaxID=1038904 RepID=A0ABW3EVQ6_9ACTN
MLDGAAAADPATTSPESPPTPPAPPPASPGTASPVTDIDAARFRSVLGRFATGVVAITAVEPGTGRPLGLVANSFTSVSLDPPLVAFCVAHTSTTWPRLRDAGRLCVNILGERQLETSRRLAARGGDKFAGVRWTESPGGAPLIDGGIAWIECSVEREHAAGDHAIVVARVHDLGRQGGDDPLIYYRGGYGGLA